MSTYPTAHGGQAVGAAPSKPGTLKAALGVTILAALGAIVNGVLILVGGADLAREVAAKALSIVTGETVEGILAKGGALLEIAATEAQSTLQVRAYLLLVPGALLLVFGLCMGKAATWARVMVTISAAFTLLFAGIVSLDTDAATAIMLASGWIAVLGSIAAIVLSWLSPNGRYAKALTQRA